MWRMKYGDGTIPTAIKICGDTLPNGKRQSASNCLENNSYPIKIADKQVSYEGLGGMLCNFARYRNLSQN